MKHKHGSTVISIILGLGMGALFRKTCKNNDCLVFKVPELNTIHNASYKYNDTCYKYELIPGKCNSGKHQY